MDIQDAGTTATDRTLDLLEAIVRDGGVRPLSVIARGLALPPSTAHRMAALLVRRGLVSPAARGHYAAGLALADLGARSDPNRILTDAARPLLRKLARETGAIAHLGVWDGDMVTYLVKEGKGAAPFTREGGQLEAYCSAIGKVLLAHLPADMRAAYLGAGPFIPLTKATVTDPARIDAMLCRVLDQGFALDTEEVAGGLFCIALPIRAVGGRVAAAVSISRQHAPERPYEVPPALRKCADALSLRLGYREGGQAAAVE